VVVKVTRKIRRAIYNPRLLFRRAVNITLDLSIGYWVALLIRILHPIIRIRVGRVVGSRIGHMIGTCEMYLYEDALGRNKGYRDYFYFSDEPVNKALVEMFARKMRFSKLAETVYRANIRLPGHSAYVVPEHSPAEYISLKVPCNVEPNKKIVEDGDAWLASMGVSPDMPLILFANRDTTFLNYINPDFNWKYHDYRNCNIESFIPMAIAMTGLGYAAIRLGYRVATPLPGTPPYIVDYASVGWSEERDIYLAHRCRMFIATTSGIADLGRLFRKPTAITNTVPFLSAVNFKSQPADLWIPKLFWAAREERLLSFSEMAEFGGGQVCRSEDYENAGIELIDNTADEITELALEIEEIIEGRQVVSEDDQELYRRFWHIVLNGRPWQGESTIALSFLRRHRSLLD